MARGNVGARVLALFIAAVLLAAARQPGGIPAWLTAKFANKPVR